MTFDHLIASYGAWGLMLGAMLEGEAVAMLGGLLSHRGVLGVWTAIPAIAAGSLLVDQAGFLLGRRFRDHPRVRKLQAGPRAAQVLRRFEAHPDAYAFGFRFLYGLRIASAVMIGTTGYPWRRLLLFNLAAALLWSSLFVGLGYLFGQTLEALFGRLHAAVHYPLALLAGAGVLAWLIQRARHRAP